MNQEEKYEFTIKLSDIIEICPRHKQERERYRGFIRFLKSKNITMNLVSRKKGHKDLSENKLKDESYGKRILKRKQANDKIINYTPSNDSEGHVGFIYMRILIIDGVKLMYIGETTNMVDRQYHWLCLNVEYGGKEIEDIRHSTVPTDWVWGILTPVVASTPDELKKKLKEEEAKWILKYETYKEDKGFNSTYGLSEYLEPGNRCLIDERRLIPDEESVNGSVGVGTH